MRLTSRQGIPQLNRCPPVTLRLCQPPTGTLVKDVSGSHTAASMELLKDSVGHGRPQALFRLPRSGDFSYFQTLDGQRFLVLEPESGAQARDQLVIIQNWAAQLRDAK